MISLFSLSFFVFLTNSIDKSGYLARLTKPFSPVFRPNGIIDTKNSDAQFSQKTETVSSYNSKPELSSLTSEISSNLIDNQNFYYLFNQQIKSGKITISNKTVEIANTVFGNDFEIIQILNCQICSFINCTFSIKSDKVLLQLIDSQVEFHNCTFSGGSKTRIFSNNSILLFFDVRFENMKSQTNGAAICAIKSKLTIQNSVFHNCCSLKEGGAVYLYETIADFKNTSFIENNSTNGYSIFSNYSQPIFQACQFTNSFKEEVKGNGNYRAPKAMISIETPPPPQTVVPATPTMTLPDQTPSISPQPTITPQPTVTQILQSNAPEKTKTYTIFIAVICSIIAVVIIIVIVVAIVRKRKARIYPKNDNEEKEPPGISVVIDRIYKEKQVIP